MAIAETANIAIVEVAGMESIEGIFPLPANELASVAVPLVVLAVVVAVVSLRSLLLATKTATELAAGVVLAGGCRWRLA